MGVRLRKAAMSVTKVSIGFAAAALLALAPDAGHAGTISVAASLDDYTTFYTTANNPASHVVTGGAYSGVADVILGRTDGTYRCSGALLSGGAYLLTAAHCAAGSGSTNRVNSATATFRTDTGAATVRLGAVSINPGWTGSVLNGSDLALIKLTTAAPTNVAQYGIYRDTDELGQVATHVGVGRSGTGLTGSTLASGTERAGLNRYDTTAAAFSFGSNRSAQLMYDFDDGLAAHDAFGWYFGPALADLGLGGDEVMAASGDSGGPAFIDGMIAGITSYGMRLSKFVGGRFSSSDINGIINSSFGEIAGDTRISSYASWIDSIVGTAPPPPVTTSFVAPQGAGFVGDDLDLPEPLTAALFGLGALAAFAARRRRNA